MNLYCTACNENHEFTPREIEEILYSMQAELSESLTEDHSGDASTYYHLFKGKDGEPSMFCLREHHWGEMVDVEVFGEHVHHLVKVRRARQGILYCLNCGEDEGLCQCTEAEKELMVPEP